MLKFSITAALLLSAGFSPIAAVLSVVTVRASIVACRWFLRRGQARTTREKSLEAAVRQRTEELEYERVRERARNSILEQLVGNQSLGIVLDGIAQYVREDATGCVCAILLKRPRGWYVAAAPGVNAAWLQGLNAPQALPFELWRRDDTWRESAQAGHWSNFLTALPGARPQAIHSRVVGNSQSVLGILLAFETGGGLPVPERLAFSLQSAAHLAFVAIEHGQYYENLRYRAHHDALTGLPNRTLFEELLALAVREAETSRQLLAVVSIDIDHFKRTNDALGPRAGDFVLAELGGRIRRAVRGADTVARIGGDEFMLVLANIRNASEVEDVCNCIMDAIRQPMLVDGKAVSPTASAGSALFPADSSDPEGLRRKADAALNCAKGQGRNRFQVFGASIDAMDRARLEEEIRLALDRDLFTVHYQPKIGAAGAFCGLEALVRLTTAQSGSISPAVFIPVAEESGLIMQLGAWVLSDVCRQMCDWHQRGMGWVPVAVNVSPAQISRSGYSREVRDCLHSYGVPPHALELELTESIVLGGGEEGERQMRDLHSIGIRFSIDDFGTGYSSLSYLYLLPVDAIKLDRSFVQAIGTDKGARRLVQAMIGVAEGLGLNVVAEGVETEEQRSILIAAGCPVMQGYLFARPGPPADIERFLTDAPSVIGAPIGTPVQLSNTDDLARIAEAIAEAIDATRLQPV